MPVKSLRFVIHASIHAGNGVCDVIDTLHLLLATEQKRQLMRQSIHQLSISDVRETPVSFKLGRDHHFQGSGEQRLQTAYKVRGCGSYKVTGCSRRRIGRKSEIIRAPHWKL